MMGIVMIYLFPLKIIQIKQMTEIEEHNKVFFDGWKKRCNEINSKAFCTLSMISRDNFDVMALPDISPDRLADTLRKVADQLNKVGR